MDYPLNGSENAKTRFFSFSQSKESFLSSLKELIWGWQLSPQSPSDVQGIGKKGLQNNFFCLIIHCLNPAEGSFETEFDAVAAGEEAAFGGKNLQYTVHILIFAFVIKNANLIWRLYDRLREARFWDNEIEAFPSNERVTFSGLASFTETTLPSRTCSCRCPLMAEAFGDASPSFFMSMYFLADSMISFWSIHVLSALWGERDTHTQRERKREWWRIFNSFGWVCLVIKRSLGDISSGLVRKTC